MTHADLTDQQLADKLRLITIPIAAIGAMVGREMPETNSLLLEAARRIEELSWMREGLEK